MKQLCVMLCIILLNTCSLPLQAASQSKPLNTQVEKIINTLTTYHTSTAKNITQEVLKLQWNPLVKNLTEITLMQWVALHNAIQQLKNMVPKDQGNVTITAIEKHANSIIVTEIATIILHIKNYVAHNNGMHQLTMLLNFPDTQEDLQKIPQRFIQPLHESMQTLKKANAHSTIPTDIVQKIARLTTALEKIFCQAPAPKKILQQPLQHASPTTQKSLWKTASAPTKSMLMLYSYSEHITTNLLKIVVTALCLKTMYYSSLSVATKCLFSFFYFALFSKEMHSWFKKPKIKNITASSCAWAALLTTYFITRWYYKAPLTKHLHISLLKNIEIYVCPLLIPHLNKQLFRGIGYIHAKMVE